mgnify:CR=1 FL=1
MTNFSKKFCAKSPFKSDSKYALTKEEEDRLYELQNRDKIKEEEKKKRIQNYEKSSPNYIDPNLVTTYETGGKNYVGGTLDVPIGRGLKALIKIAGKYFLTDK